MFWLFLNSMKKNFNRALKQQNDKATAPAVNFASLCGTRFCYELDGMKRGIKNKKVLRDMVDE